VVGDIVSSASAFPALAFCPRRTRFAPLVVAGFPPLGRKRRRRCSASPCDNSYAIIP